MSASVWAAQYKEGILSLTAHMMTMKYGLNGNGTPINTVQQETTSKAIGKLSKGMGSKNSGIYVNAGDYALTVYGRRLLGIADADQTNGTSLWRYWFWLCRER